MGLSIAFVILFLFLLKVFLWKPCRMSQKGDLGKMCVTSLLEKCPGLQRGCNKHTMVLGQHIPAS